MIAERQDEAVGVDTGFEPPMMGALRMARACRLLVAAVVMLAVLAACDLPGPDGADSAPQAVTEAPASGAPAPVATAQPTVVATATPARPVAQALPTATAAAVETRVPRAPVRTPTETAVPGRDGGAESVAHADPGRDGSAEPVTDSRGFRAANADAGWDCGADAGGAGRRTTGDRAGGHPAGVSRVSGG